MAGTFLSHSDQASLGIVTRLSTLFENVDDYRCLLACRDLTAQRLLDLFQTVCAFTNFSLNYP